MLDSFFSTTSPARPAQWLSRDPLALTALAAIAGILLADYFILHSLWLALAIAGLSLASFFWRGNALPLIALTINTFAFIHTLELRWIDQFPLTTELHEIDAAKKPSPPSQVSVQGLVINEVSLSPKKRSASLLLRLQSLTREQESFPTQHHVRVRINSLPHHLRDLAYGDTLQFTGQIRPLPQARNPGSFSPAIFYRRSAAAVAQIHCNPGDKIRRLSSGSGTPLIHIAHQSRDWLASAITRDLDDDPETASIIQAMVLGASENTPEAIEEQFRLSGALHIFAVSGLHIGLFGFIIWHLLKLLRIPRRTAVWLIIPAILFYATVTGLRPSACRAAVMGSIVLFSYIVGRRPRLINSLGLAALLLLAYDSQQLFLPGFQLSFAVLTAIAVLTPVFMKLFSHSFEIDPFIPRHLISRFKFHLSQSCSTAGNYFSVSLAAWLGSLPLIIYHFQLVTPVSILANCFLIPTAMLVLSLAVMSLCSTLAQLPLLSNLFNHCNWLAAKTCSLLTAFFASLPGGHFHFSLTPPPVDAEHPAYIAVLDTQSGGASHVVSFRRPASWTPRRNSLLIDTGSERSFQYITHPFFRYRGINHFQSLYLTHNDYQHIGGAKLVVPRYHPAQIFTPADLDRARSLQTLLPILENRQLPLTPLSSGDILNPNSEIKIEVLFPPNNTSIGPRADDNGLVLRLYCAGWHILFMGDSGFETEKWLLQHRREQLSCDVLVKGQHGSDLSGLEEFIKTLNPQAIISSNQKFPANEIIPPAWRSILARQQITLFDQQQSGAVEILIGTKTLKIKAYLNGQSLTLSKRKP